MHNDMRQMTTLGRSIEDESFAIVDREVGEHRHSPEQWEIVRRVIHATADFEFRDLMEFHHDAIASGCAAMLRGANLVADVQMILAGVSQERLMAMKMRSYCEISDPLVIARAKAANTTRAIEAMRELAQRKVLQGSIVAIGNAPTALLEILRIVEESGQTPALVIGVPVGFVSAAESKLALAHSSIPSILSRGRKGGSTIAVAIVHALLRLCAQGVQ